MFLIAILWMRKVKKLIFFEIVWFKTKILDLLGTNEGQIWILCSVKVSKKIFIFKVSTIQNYDSEQLNFYKILKFC